MTTEYPEFTDGATLVVGGSGGLGAAICLSLAKAGSNIAFTYYSRKKNADKVATSVRETGRDVMAEKLDMEDPEAISQFVTDIIRRFGHIHSVVYAAGPPIEFLYINEIKPEEWARVCSADINGCFNMIAATLPHLREQSRGSIVNIITAAVDRAPPRDILSAAPKAAIEALTRGLAREEGRSGIRANCIGPGYIEAGLGLTTVHEHTKDFVDRMVQAIPLKRAGQAEDIANAVTFLLSDKAAYITGESIAVAGGLQLA